MASSTHRIAKSVLSRDGIAAIWELHLDAAMLYRDGHPELAEIIVEVADALEETIFWRLVCSEA